MIKETLYFTKDVSNTSKDVLDTFQLPMAVPKYLYIAHGCSKNFNLPIEVLKTINLPIEVLKTINFPIEFLKTFNFPIEVLNIFVSPRDV